MYDARGAVVAVNELLKKSARLYHVISERAQPTIRALSQHYYPHRIVHPGGSCYRGLTTTRTKMIAEVGSDCVMSVQKLFFVIPTTYYSHLNRWPNKCSIMMVG